MIDKTRLLKEITEIVDFHCRCDSGREELAQAVIDATADWFEDVAQSIGIIPSAIPTLLRWQAHQHEHLDGQS